MSNSFRITLFVVDCSMQFVENCFVVHPFVRMDTAGSLSNPPGSETNTQATNQCINQLIEKTNIQPTNQPTRQATMQPTQYTQKNWPTCPVANFLGHSLQEVLDLLKLLVVLLDVWDDRLGLQAVVNTVRHDVAHLVSDQVLSERIVHLLDTLPVELSHDLEREIQFIK